MRSAAILDCWGKVKDVDRYPIYIKEIRQKNNGKIFGHSSDFTFRPKGIFAIVGNVGAGKSSFFEYISDSEYKRRSFLPHLAILKDGTQIDLPGDNIPATIFDPSRELRDINSVIFQFASTFDQNEPYFWSGAELDLLRYVLGENYQRIGFQEVDADEGVVPRFIVYDDDDLILDNSSLSQGEQLVIFIYWYLSKKNAGPGIYLLEEPETGLSPATQSKLLDMLAFLSSDRKKQLFISTHSPSVVSALGSENVILMKKDRCSYWSPAAEDDSLEELGLKLGKNNIFFVEDRKAALMIEYLLGIYGGRSLKRTQFIFLGGESHVYEVVDRIGDIPSEIGILGILDADERGKNKYQKSNANFLFLPGSLPPEIEVAQAVKANPDLFSEKLMLPPNRVSEGLRFVRGRNGHDFFEEFSKYIYGQYTPNVFTAGVSVWFLTYPNRTEIERLLVAIDPSISGSAIVAVNHAYPVQFERVR